MHVDWADMVRMMMHRSGDGNRYGNSNRNRGGDVIDVPILLLFFMRRFHWSLVVWLLN